MKISAKIYILVTLILTSCQNKRTEPNIVIAQDYRDVYAGFYSFTTTSVIQSFYEDSTVSRSIGLIQKGSYPHQILIIVDTTTSELRADNDHLSPSNSFELYLCSNGDLIKDSTTFPFKNEIIGNLRMNRVSFRGQFSTWGTGTSIDYHHGEKIK